MLMKWGWMRETGSFSRALVELFDGGPVGLSTLAAALNEDSQTIEDIYEPYLIQKGLLERTPRGGGKPHIIHGHI